MEHTGAQMDAAHDLLPGHSFRLDIPFLHASLVSEQCRPSTIRCNAAGVLCLGTDARGGGDCAPQVLQQLSVVVCGDACSSPPHFLLAVSPEENRRSLGQHHFLGVLLCVGSAHLSTELLL